MYEKCQETASLKPEQQTDRTFLTILILTRFGQLLFPHMNSLDSRPLGPHFVAVNNKNEIVVTDFHNHSVKVKKENLLLQFLEK